jgi:hypothetical protein
MSTEECGHIIKLMDYEIDNYLWLERPKYQSHYNMHVKYSNDKIFSLITKRVIKLCEKLYNEKVYIKDSWFNISKEDSEFFFHTHHDTFCTAVVYVKGCDNYGTIAKINNNEVNWPSKNKSIMLMNPNIEHKIPIWNGIDRYTIAFDLLK